MPSRLFFKMSKSSPSLPRNQKGVLAGEDPQTR